LHRHNNKEAYGTASVFNSGKNRMSMTAGYLNSFLVQESISLMFVALGLSIIGVGYARLKSKEFLQLHRWIMGGATILTLVSIFFVMIPSLYIYYIAPSINFFSSFSILQLIHSAIGVPPVILTVMYLFNDLPQPTKKWMRITVVLWLASIALGAAVYYTMPS
jgi:uncharacterized membrane protein YozB (DUF420 family)